MLWRVICFTQRLLTEMSSHFKRASLVAQLVRNPPEMRETWFNPWVGKIPWRNKWLPTLVFWPREFFGLYSPWGCKESDTTEQLSLTLKMPSEQWTGMFHQLSGDGALDKKWSESHSVVLDSLLSHGL